MWRPTSFTLVVDDFGVKFVGKEHAQHLYDTLDRWYDVTTDWSGSKYVGITLKWDYDKRTLDTSVPGYVKGALHELQHPPPTKPQHTPAQARAIQYGKKIQTTDVDSSLPFDKSGIKAI